MKPLYRKLVASLLSCLVCLSAWAGGMPVVAPEEVGLSSERLERLTRAMEKGVEAGHFPGAVAGRGYVSVATSHPRWWKRTCLDDDGLSALLPDAAEQR